jgi:hypothetical protein
MSVEPPDPTASAGASALYGPEYYASQVPSHFLAVSAFWMRVDKS